MFSENWIPHMQNGEWFTVQVLSSPGSHMTAIFTNNVIGNQFGMQCQTYADTRGRVYNNYYTADADNVYLIRTCSR